MSINQKVNTNILLNLLHPKYKNNIKTNGPQTRQETVPTIYQNKRKYKGKGLTLSGWQIGLIVDGLGCLRGPVVFCCQRLHRSVRSTVDAKIFLVVRRGWQVSDQPSDGQSQRKFENERHRPTATSHQKRQRVNIYREISTLAPFFSNARILSIETVKYIQNKGASLYITLM